MKHLTMKKLAKKALALSLAAVLSLGILAGCGSSSSSSDDTSSSGDTASETESMDTALAGTADGETIKIGVLVADVSGEEALAFRAYYEDYIAENYNVTFQYTNALEDAAGEKSAIEEFAAQGYDAIISLSSSDRATQIETCESYGLYYAVASGMLEDEQYETYKEYEYFVGQIGPSMDAEYEAGYAMGEYYASLGVSTVAIYGAFIPNSMHVYRLAGVIAGLGASYDGNTDADSIAASLFTDQSLDLSKVECGDVEIVSYFQGYGDTTTDELNAAIQAEPDAFLSVGMATTFFAQSLNTAGIQYSDIDSFTSTNAELMSSGYLTYIAGKYSSSIGPIFAAVVDAVNGNLIRNEDGSALSISQGYLVATDSDTFDAYYSADQGESPIISTDVLDTIIGLDVTIDDITAVVEAN